MIASLLVNISKNFGFNGINSGAYTSLAVSLFISFCCFSSSSYVNKKSSLSQSIIDQPALIIIVNLTKIKMDTTPEHWHYIHFYVL